MAAVIWTDVVQMVLYVAGTLVSVVLLGHRVAGGWQAIHSVAAAAGKLTIFHFALSLSVNYTFWAGLIGGCFLTMATHGTDQLLVQRLLAVDQIEMHADLLALRIAVRIFDRHATNIETLEQRMPMLIRSKKSGNSKPSLFLMSLKNIWMKNPRQYYTPAN